MIKTTVLLASCAAVAGHAILSNPVSRLGLERLGTKAQKYTHAASGSNGAYPLDPAGIMETCGEKDPGADTIKETYNVGDKISFSWLMTLAHPGAPENVRLAIKYSDTDTFGANVLFASSAADISGSTTPGEGTITKNATAVLTKACDSCVLQWSWDSKVDGGGYIDCADIKILPSSPKKGNPKCVAFCGQLLSTCDKDKQYETVYSPLTGAAESPECLEDCNAMDRTVLDGAFHGDTFECRAYHLSVAVSNPGKVAEEHCPHAGKDGGGVCVDKNPCETFCATYRKVTCKQDVENVPEYGTEAKCLATCATFKKTSLHGAITGNTLQCREYHLGVAYQSKANADLNELHCGHVTKNSARKKCVSSVTECETYCGTLDEACGFGNSTTTDDCEENCLTMVKGTDGDKSGDTLACRSYHLGLVSLSRGDAGEIAKHCTHASADGGGVCVTPPPATTIVAGSAETLRSSLLAGVVVLVANLAM